MNTIVHRGWFAAAAIAPLALAFLTLTGCGDVEVATGMDFPKPLVEQLPMTVGVYYSDEFRKYAHNEQRWGVDWKVDLGQFHVRMGDKLFSSAFTETLEVKSLEDVPTQPVRAIIEPRIEQYSFITPRDTGAKYYAVTIRYRLNVFTPDGHLADSLTFTGYGSAPSSGMTSTAPMIQATKVAMRDAAAKFLVQFPEQPVAKRMIASLPLIEQSTVGSSVAGSAPSASGGGLVIETMPIVDTPPATTPGSGGTNTSPPPSTTEKPAQTPPPEAPSTLPTTPTPTLPPKSEEPSRWTDL